MYFNNNMQWDQGRGHGVIQPSVYNIPAAPQGPSFLDTLLGLAGAGMNFASGNIMGGIQGLAGTAQGAPPQMPSAQPTQVNQGNPQSTTPTQNEKTSSKPDVEEKKPKQQEIETTPVPTDPMMMGNAPFDPNVVMQLLHFLQMGGMR